MKEKLCGIYSIKNINNNKLYIGSSTDIYKRWEQHKKMLKNNKHHSQKLQRAWNCSKEEYFIFEIIEECSKEALLTTEDKYILKHDSFKNGYNMTESASKLNPKHSYKYYKKKKEKEKHDIEYAELQKLCNELNIKLDFDIKVSRIRRFIDLIKYYRDNYIPQGYMFVSFNNHHVVPYILIATHDKKISCYICIKRKKIQIEWFGEKSGMEIINEW